MTQDPLTIALLGGMAGVIVSMVGAWAKAQVERIGAAENKLERDHERDADWALEQTASFAEVAANVKLLMGERGKCDVLGERVAGLEAFQRYAQPLLDESAEGLKAVARIEERLITLFRGFDAMTKRVDNWISRVAQHELSTPAGGR